MDFISANAIEDISQNSLIRSADTACALTCQMDTQEELCTRIAASLRAIQGGERNQIRKVDGCVEGSFILKNVLDKMECEAIMTAVRSLNEYVVSSQLRARSAEVAETEISEIPTGNKSRRPSQHHTPCYVDNDALSSLTDRVRPHLPRQAGPQNSSYLADSPISTFLRCYDYHTSDASTPHFDRSFNFHEKDPMGRNTGHLLQFTAYSMVLYLNDDFEGGHTTFFPLQPDTEDVVRSRRGNTSMQEVTADTPRVSVTPKQGDVLIFPHGRHAGCHPDPLHEGSVILSGRKTIIRTDIIYTCVQKNSHKQDARKSNSQNSMISIAEMDASKAPMMEEEASKAPMMEMDASKAPMMEEEASKAPMMEEEASKAPMMEEEASKAPMIEEDASKAPMMEEEASKAPMIEEEASKAPMIEEDAVNDVTMNISEATCQYSASDDSSPPESKWISAYKVNDKETAFQNWSCINDSLCQNSCWICQAVFPRGKKKKVFMISQILQVFKEIYNNSLEGNEDDRIKLLTAFEEAVPNVCKCWQSFLYLEGNEQMLASALEKVNTQVWASGLACCRNELCTIIFKALFADQGPDERIASLKALGGTFTRSLNCPPGCDCGWQFIALPTSK
jgi:hypothetical protein